MTCEECIHKSVCYRVDSVQSDYAQKCGDFVNNLCDSCITPRCIFQSGIVRKKCVFYTPPRVESNQYLIPYLMHKEMGIPLTECQKAYELAIEYLRSKEKVKG